MPPWSPAGNQILTGGRHSLATPQRRIEALRLDDGFDDDGDEELGAAGERGDGLPPTPGVWAPLSEAGAMAAAAAGDAPGTMWVEAGTSVTADHSPAADALRFLHHGSPGGAPEPASRPPPPDASGEPTSQCWVYYK